MASKLRSALVVLPLAALIVLTGCTAETIPDSGTSTPEPGPAATEEAFVSSIPADELGLVLPGDAAKDDEGSFRNAVLNTELASAKYMTLATAPNAAELEAAGYTDEDLIAAQESAYSTLVELNLDGPLLEDSDTTTLEWFEAGGNEIFGAVSQDMIHETLKSSPTESLFVQNAFAAPLVHDGDLRIKGVDISTDSLGLQEFEGENFLLVNFKFDALYRSSADGILKTVQAVEGAEYTRADLEAVNPAFVEDEASYKVSGTGLMSYGLSDLKRTEGMVFSYSSGLIDSDGNFLKLGGN